MKRTKITVSKDRLEATITIEEKGGAFPSRADIYRAIQQAGVTWGINESVIDKVIVDQQPVKELVFARGKRPIRGKDASLVWYVDLSDSSRPVITEEGKADFKQLKQFAPVEQDQELVSKLPATKGTGGRTVTGETVWAAGKDVAFPAGKNTTATKDGLTLCSAMDGYAFLESGKLHVDNVYHIKGDVDFSTGNVKFDGTVFIDGDIRSGFRVDATDSIYINGNVEAADIYSQKGDVFIQLGILGQGRAKILAGGNLHCGFVQDATVGAKRNVIIDRYTMNSGISSGGKVILKQNEGLIRGGKVFADQGVEAIEIGSSQDISTEVGISGNGSYEVNSARWAIKRDTEKLRLKRSLLNKRIAFLKLLDDRLEGLSGEKRRVLASTMKEVGILEAEIEALVQREKTLVNSHTKRDYMKSVIVRDKLHRGVIITIGHQQYYTEDMLHAVKIYRNGDEILVEELLET